MSQICMRQKIVAKYQQKCQDKDILPASAYEIQLLIDCAFEALSEPTEGMRSVGMDHLMYSGNIYTKEGEETIVIETYVTKSFWQAMIKAAQEGK